MNNNIKKIFLLTTVILLFIGLSTISATDSADDMTLSTDINTQESTISTDTAAINNIDNNLNTQYAKSDKNIKKDDNITEDIGGNSTYINRINLNNENIGDYFDIDYSEAVTRDTFNDSTILQFDEIIDGVNFWYFNTTASDITITTNNNIVFTDQQFLIESPNVTFKDISFEYTSEFEYSKGIIAEESGFKMENCQVYYDASIIDGELNTILLIKGVNSIIKNSTFDCHIVSTGIDWDPDSLSETAEMPTTVPIVVLADYVNITDNTITINEKGSDGSDYPSFYGIYIGGNYINFTRNNISLTGSNGYVYTVYVKGTESKSTSYVTISYNNITGISQHNYTAGVYIDGSNYHDISVINNNIYAVSSKDYKDGMALQDVVYAVAQTNFAYQGGTYREGTGGVYDNSFINNTIIAEGHQVYGFEQYGGDNTLISGNTIMVEGSRAQALGVIGYNTVIEGNSLTAIGDTAEGESSPDYVPAITAGVQVLHGSQTTITNNNINVTAARGILIQDSDNVITNNNITVFDYDYSIETRTNATGNLIENNLLITDAGNGSKTINDAAGENTIGNNTDLQELIITFIGLDDVVCTLGDEMELFVTIENADEEEQYDYDGQSVILYANGEEIDSQEIEGGFVLFICDVPVSWYKNITLVVNYPGNDECAPAEAEVNLTVNIPTSIQAEDNIIAQPNSQLTSISVIDIMNNTVDAASIDVYENDTLISNLSNYTITGTDSYPIKLVFDGGLLSDGYTYLSSEKEVTITVEQPKPSVNISLDLEDEYKLGDTIEIITGVEDEDEQTIVGLNVDLYCNDEYVTTLVSDEDGCISYDYTPTAVGNYTFTVKVNDDNYASSEATKTVIVNKNIVPVLIMMELDDEYELGNAVDIMANVVDDNYDNVAGVNVDLYIDDEFVASVESDEDGMVSYEYTPTAAG
ncbi:MAG: right-handed parallel beta-helix repeat-containing protein, partial [Methanosphaera stadtmanae]|nr:right-handed parallel beta-helix repeat-containing protein [Methanosphaera stadtmanae]